MSWKRQWCGSIVKRLREHPLASVFAHELSEHEKKLDQLLDEDAGGSLQRWKQDLFSVFRGEQRKREAFENAVAEDFRAWVNKKCEKMPRCESEAWWFEFLETKEKLEQLVDSYGGRTVKEKRKVVTEVVTREEDEKPAVKKEVKPKSEPKRQVFEHENLSYRAPILGDPNAAPPKENKKVTLFGP